MKSLIIFIIATFISITAHANTVSVLTNQSHLTVSLLSFFGIGVLLAFTPCVLPMVPILSAILVGQKQKDTRHAFGLSFIFVLSMALTYAIAGVLAGYFGSTIQTLLQTPTVIISFSLVFVVMALSMFNIFHLNMPRLLHSQAHKIQANLKHGSYVGVATMGILSTLIASPCITAPLISVLTYISQTGNSLYGGVILFVMALGMGLPLILFGIGQTALIPKTGPWMNDIKHIFGVMLLGLAIWMLSRVISPAVTMYLWSALLILSAVALGALDFQKSIPVILKGIYALTFVFGCILLVGAAKGNNNILFPLLEDGAPSALSQRPPSALFKYADTQVDLDKKLNIAKQQNQAVLVEFFASWCPDCKKVDTQVLNDAEVRKAMHAITAIRVDVSERNPELAKMMERYNVYGVPTMIFFTRDGKFVPNTDKEITKQGLIKQINQLL